MEPFSNNINNLKRSLLKLLNKWILHMYYKRYILVNGCYIPRVEDSKYCDVDYQNSSWGLISEVNEMGWIQDKPHDPPVTQIIASKGMLKEANKILLKIKKQA